MYPDPIPWNGRTDIQTDRQTDNAVRPASCSQGAGTTVVWCSQYVLFNHVIASCTVTAHLYFPLFSRRVVYPQLEPFKSCFCHLTACCLPFWVTVGRTHITAPSKSVSRENTQMICMDKSINAWTTSHKLLQPTIHHKQPAVVTTLYPCNAAAVQSSKSRYSKL